jgi:hypothetical protein
VAGTLNVKYADVVGGRYDGPVVGIRHKFHGEDVGSVAGQDGGSQAELGRGGIRMVGMDINSVIIRPGGKEASGL